jgi:hypothetical protein
MVLTSWMLFAEMACWHISAEWTRALANNSDSVRVLTMMRRPTKATALLMSSGPADAPWVGNYGMAMKIEIEDAWEYLIDTGSLRLYRDTYTRPQAVQAFIDLAAKAEMLAAQIEDNMSHPEAVRTYPMHTSDSIHQYGVELARDMINRGPAAERQHFALYLQLHAPTQRRRQRRAQRATFDHHN